MADPGLLPSVVSYAPRPTMVRSDEWNCVCKAKRWFSFEVAIDVRKICGRCECLCWRGGGGGGGGKSIVVTWGWWEIASQDKSEGESEKSIVAN